MNIHDTGKSSAGFGEGFYVGSDNSSWNYKPACDNNTLKNSTIGPGVAAELADIKEGTTGTVIDNCIFHGTGISGSNYADSFVDVKGNNATISNCTAYRENNSKIVDAFQVHQQLSGWGLNASFINNNVTLDNTTCYVVNAVSGTSATAQNNTRTPAGNMYLGNVTVISGTPTPTPVSATPTPTPTSGSTTPTPTSGSATPTPTPVPATPTPTPIPVSGNIKVQYMCGYTTDPGTKVQPLYKIYNTGTTAIDISTIKVRYYYTIDTQQTQNFYIDYASGVSSSNCVGTFVQMSTPKTGADYYCELSFASGAGTIAPGGSIQVKTRFSKSDFSSYTQSNDYSFDATKTAYTDYTKTPAYINGALAWGTEP
jgi:hypothetical protein